MLKQREYWIDLSKFVAFFFVLIIHNPLISDDLRTVSHSFIMSMFFILSGYLYKPLPLKEGLKKDFVGLVIPYYLLNIAGLTYVFISSLLQHGILIDFDTMFFSVSQILAGNLTKMRTLDFTGVTVSTWFLMALFSVKILNYLCDALKIHKFIVVFAVICAGIAYLLVSTRNQIGILQLNSALMAMPFFVFGRLSREYGFFEKLLSIKAVYKLAIVIPLLIILISLSLYNGHVDLFSCNIGKNIFLYYFGEIFGSIVVILFCSFFNRYPSHFVTTCANGFVLMLGTNLIMIRNLYNFNSFLGIDYGWYTPIAVSIGVLLLNYPLILLCERYFPLIIGKGFKKKTKKAAE